MRVAIIENTGMTHHGLVGVALHEAGALVDVYRPDAGDALPAFGAHDALVVFGGEQNARDDAAHPYLPALCDLMRNAGQSGRAVLGICLGSQLLARAFGAENRIGTAPELGWQPLTLTEAGAADPVTAALPRQFHAFQWHSDTFTLPPGATQLVTGAVPLQAFRIGRATYGTQFHFEASRPVVARLTATFPDAAEALRPGWLQDHAAEAPTLGADADAAGLALARAFVAAI